MRATSCCSICAARAWASSIIRSCSRSPAFCACAIMSCAWRRASSSSASARAVASSRSLFAFSAFSIPSRITACRLSIVLIIMGRPHFKSSTKTIPKLTSCERKASALMPSPLKISARTKTCIYIHLPSFPQKVLYCALPCSTEMKYVLFPFPFSKGCEPYSISFPGYRVQERSTSCQLTDEQDEEGNQQSVDSDSFGESQTKNQVRADQRLGFRVAPDGVERLTGGQTDTNARTDSAQTDSQRDGERRQVVGGGCGSQGHQE